MRNLFYGIAMVAILAMVVAISGNSKKQEIAVIVPLQHAAMDAIVDGLKQELGDEIPVHVYNAQGDPSLQSAILQQLELMEPLVVLPIGTAATQMTLQRMPQANVIHLAAKFFEEDRMPNQPVSGILDELPPENALQLAVLLIPSLKKVTLIHSASEKTFPEAAAFEEEAERLGVQVQRLMIHSQPELYTMAQQVDKDSQLLAVLKDHMVVAGIATLVECAEARGIPVMAADEGSVQGGATFAAGVPEASIGVAGARLVKKVVSGTAVSELPIQTVEDIHLFFRQGSQNQFNFDEVAASVGYRAKEVEL